MLSFCHAHDSVDEAGLGPKTMNRSSQDYRGTIQMPSSEDFRRSVCIKRNCQKVLVPRWADTNRYIRASSGIGETLSSLLPWIFGGFETGAVGAQGDVATSKSFGALDRLADHPADHDKLKIRRPCGLNLDSRVHSDH